MRFITFLLFILLLKSPLILKGQNKIIYVGDPMCSWCYGFAPELEKVINKFNQEVEVEVVTGGLRPYFDQSIADMKDFLKGHWEDVNKASGQIFNYGILDQRDLIYDTEPSCRAVVVVRHINPAKKFEFFKLVQEAFYFHNKDLRQVSSYEPILTSLDIDKELFKQYFESEKFKTLVKADFQRATNLGVRGFPTVLLQTNEGVSILSREYITSESLSQLIESKLD